ncbi:MAG: hypothetical protein JXA04_11265 [Gammaproteobacteria bacterium]|nr:hypothetical protein [Gammaproteobacteria bacterium]
MKKLFAVYLTLSAALLTGCGDGGGSTPVYPDIVVNTLEDSDVLIAGTTPLRAALAAARSNQRIVFDPALDGGVIELSIVAEEHTVLPGEVMGMRDEPSGPVSYLEGYFDRDYGRSALYARKNVVIDASALPSGITIAWTGGDANPARVLAVYGDLFLRNVSITGGKVVAEDISATNSAQPWTLARGGALAVWGVAQLENCRLYDNHLEGDFDSSRDRGAFGGGIYADVVVMNNCVVSGNTILGGGAAGGGVYSVGGVLSPGTISTVEQSSVTGNRISALFTYGGGVYSDGGGIGNSNMLLINNSTIARNLVDTPPGLPPFLLAMGYWRGGGVYISNGYLAIRSSTIVENEVHGVPRTDSLGRRNLAGGVAATVGNAHAVEEMRIGHSIIAGNTVHEIGGGSYAHDIFTGSLLHFKSRGYNRIGVLDFSQILVPVGEIYWESLSRRHYPKNGDIDGVNVADVLDLTSGINQSQEILSAGTDAGEFAVISYMPQGNAVDQIPLVPYTIYETYAEHIISPGGVNNFLQIMLDRIEDQYNVVGFANDFTTDFETFLQTVDSDEDTVGVQPYTDPDGSPIVTLADTQWFGPAVTWPKELPNYPYIEFWHRLDSALQAESIPQLGQELLGDTAWAGLFSSGVLPENNSINMWVVTRAGPVVQIQAQDQVGTARPVNGTADIGAIEFSVWRVL